MTFAIIISFFVLIAATIIIRRVARRMRQIGRILDKESPDE